MAVKTRTELKSENASDFPDNITRLISPADLRGQMDDIVDSAIFPEDGLEGEPGPPGPPGSLNDVVYDMVSLGGEEGYSGTSSASDPNTSALMDLKAELLAADATGQHGATLVVPPGEWRFFGDPNNSGAGLGHFQWDTDFKGPLKVVGYGATLTTANGEDPAFSGSGLVPPYYPYLGIFTPYTEFLKHFPINTALPFAKTVTLNPGGSPAYTGTEMLTTPGAVGGRFKVGETIMIASGDCQFNGAPPNMQYHDYVTIKAINFSGDLYDSSTWAYVPNSIYFEPPLSNSHLSTYPEYNEDSFDPLPDDPGTQKQSWGKARIWKLNLVQNSSETAATPPVETPGSGWDVERVYEGFNAGSGGTAPIAGKRLSFINIRAPDLSPSGVGWLNVQGCTFDGGPEAPPAVGTPQMSNQFAIDKISGYLNIEDADIKNTFAANTSSSEFLRVVRTTFHGDVWLGAKYTYMQHCKMLGLSVNTFGLADVVLDQCKIAVMGTAVYGYSGPDSPVTDFTNGTYRITKVDPWRIGSNIPMIGAVVWPTIGGVLGHDIGRLFGIVTNVYDDATYIYYDIAGLPDTLPAVFTSGGGSPTIHFNVQKLRRVMSTGSHGCWQVEMLNQKVDTNIQQTKIKMTFTGAPPLAGIVREWVWGNLKSVKINVIKPYTGPATQPTGPIPPATTAIAPAGAVTAFFSGAAYTPAHVNAAIGFDINMHVPGVREITKTGVTGMQIGDRLANGGGSPYANIADIFTRGGLTYAFRTPATGVLVDLSGEAAHYMPMIEFSAETDVEPWDNWARTDGGRDLAIY